VSYADFITLLFAFFVVMFASSQTDKTKAAALSQAVSNALENGKSTGMPPAVAKILGGTIEDKGQGNGQMKGPGGAQKASKENSTTVELAPTLNVLTKELENEIKSGKVQVSSTPRGLVVSLSQAVFFPSGGDVVDPRTYAVVEKLAGALRDISNPLRVEGHTDSVPIHTARFRSNWELSASRSIAMMEVMTKRFGIAAHRMAIAGYADTMPLESNDSETGRARNRRVDLVILNNYAQTREPQVAPPAARKQ
jgi:chemotaxis protein MotB